MDANSSYLQYRNSMCLEYRYHFATNATHKIESRSKNSCYRQDPCTLANRVVFQWPLRTLLRRGRVLSGRSSCFGYPQYASSTASFNALSARNSILFPEVQSASPTFFVVVHRLHLVSRFPLTLLPFNPTQLYALSKVSQRDRLPSSESSLFSREPNPSSQLFLSAFLESHYRALNATGKLRSLLPGNFASRQTATTQL